MKAKKTAAVLQLRNPKDGFATLTVEYKDPARAFKRISTGIRIIPGKWDAATNTIKAQGSQNPTADTKKAREKLSELNALIDMLERTLKRWPYVSEINAAQEAAAAPKPQRETPLVDEMQTYIDSQSRWQPATRKSFLTLLQNIKDYQTANDTMWALSTLTNAEIRKFQQWQLDTYDYKNSTAGKRTRLLRQFLAEHPAPGVILAKVKPLNDVLLTAPVVLTIKEIEALRALDLSPTSRLGKVRNLQVLEIFAGLRVSDLMRLQHHHIHAHEIIIKEKKTRNSSSETRRIPILPQAREVLDLYTDPQTGILTLPTISDQKFNEYIAELAPQYLADTKVLITRKHREEVTETWELKSEHVTSHTNRRSYCSLLLSLGYSIRETMALSGHKSVSAFQRYMGHLELKADTASEIAARYAQHLSKA